MTVYLHRTSQMQELACSESLLKTLKCKIERLGSNASYKNIVYICIFVLAKF